MPDRQLEDLFERYRSERDLSALGALFDQAAPELLALAAHLAPDLAEAEDLVQATFLAAIEKPHAFDARQRLLPWLFTILAHHASKARRRARRVIDPRRLTTRTAEDPLHAAGSSEAQRVLAEALASLPPLYATVLKRHLLDGKTPTAIALELARAPGTVRMQIQRGLALLRRALPPGLAFGAVLTTATRGHAAVKAAVLHAASTTAAAFSIASFGSLLMSAKMSVAVIGLVAGVATWLAWPRPATPPVASPAASPTSSPTATALPSAIVPTRSEVAPADAGAGAVPRSENFDLIALFPPFGAPPRRERADGSGCRLVGRLIGLAPGEGSQAEIVVSRRDATTRGSVREDGSFDVDVTDLCGLPAGSERPGLQRDSHAHEPSMMPLLVRATHPHYCSTNDVVYDEALGRTLVPGERIEIRRDLELRPACLLTGNVRVPAGFSLADVRVKISPDDEQVSCDAEGRYVWRTDRQGELLVRAQAEGLWSAMVRCRLEPGHELQLPTLVLEPGTCEISGSIDLPPSITTFRTGLAVSAVRRDQPRSAPGDQLELVDRDNAREFTEVRASRPDGFQQGRVQADGSFRLKGLEPGDWELDIHGIDSWLMMPLAEPVVVHAPAEDVQLGRTRCRLTVLARYGDDHPAAGVRVLWSDGEHREERTADEHGRMAIVADATRDYTVTLSGDGGQPVVVAMPAAGRARDAVITVSLSPAGQPPSLLLELPAGATPEASLQVRLRAQRTSSGEEERSLDCPLDGRTYRCPLPAAGTYEVTVGAADKPWPAAFFGAFLRQQHFTMRVAAGEQVRRVLDWRTGGRVRVEVDGFDRPGEAWARCTLRTPDGTIVRPRIVSAHFGVSSGHGTTRDGALSLRDPNALEDCWPAGRYELRAENQDWQIDPVWFEVLDREQTIVRLIARHR